MRPLLDVLSDLGSRFDAGLILPSGGGLDGTNDTDGDGEAAQAAQAAAVEAASAAVAGAANELSSVLSTVEDLDPAAAQAVAGTLSSLFDVQSATAGSESSASAAAGISAAVDQLARAATSAALAAASAVNVTNGTLAAPVVISSPNLNMSINIRPATALASAPIECDSSAGVPAAVNMPEDVLSNVPGIDPSLPVAAVLHTSTVNLHDPAPGGGSVRRRRLSESHANATNATTTASPTVSFTISQAGSELKIEGAANPINISIPYQSSAAGTARPPCVGEAAEGASCDTVVVCQFWNKTSEQWSTDGCATTLDATGAVGCSCTHLTEFIAFEFPTSGDELLAALLSSVSFNSLDMDAVECATNFSRSWRTVPVVWGCNIVLMVSLAVLMGNAVYRDRSEIATDCH